MPLALGAREGVSLAMPSKTKWQLAALALVASAWSCCHSPRSVSAGGLRLVDAVTAAETYIRVNGFTNIPGDPAASDPGTLMFTNGDRSDRQDLAKVMPLRLNTAEGRAFAVRWLPDGYGFDAVVLFRYCRAHMAYYDPTGEAPRGAAFSVLVSRDDRIGRAHLDFNAVGADWMLSEGSATAFAECR